jgi:citronellol/citronellal dehydrogenase
MSYTLYDRTVVISGGSRGIGLEIAKKLASLGANIVLLAKTDKPHTTLEGTIYTAAEQIEYIGVKCLPLVCDVRNDEQVEKAIQQTMSHFGGIDALVNNASAVFLTDTKETDMKHFDLMMGVNVRATFMLSRTCLPMLSIAPNAHILNIAPPIEINPVYLHSNVAYAISKYAMSMCTLGMAHEFYYANIAVNSLWPRTAIDTAALKQFTDQEIDKNFLRKPSIMADAAAAILVKPPRACTGAFLIDDLVLLGEGVKDFSPYAYNHGHDLIKDLFLPSDLPPLPDDVKLIDFQFKKVI